MSSSHPSAAGAAPAKGAAGLKALKIAKIPAAFLGFAEKYNHLVDAISTIQGRNGIKVTTSEKNIIIEIPNANIAAVVSSNGSLKNVYASTPDVVSYPTTLKVQNSSYTLSMDGSGIKMVNNTKSIVLDSVGLTMSDTSTGKSLSLAFASLTQNVTLRADAYCNNNTNASMLHLGSSPY
jgi:hypothetical protein